MSNLPVVSVVVNGQPVTNLIRGWDVRMGFGEHTIALLDILYAGPFGTSESIPTFAEMSPVEVVWGLTPDVRTFYGYINHHEVVPDAPGTGSTKVLMRYVLIGTTQPFNNEHTRSWASISASYIAREIAKSNGMRAIVSPTNRVLDYWSQSGESDLALMNELATESGYRFWADGSTLYFLDPNLLLTGPLASNVPTYTYNRQPGVPDTLTEFALVSGQNVPGKGILADRVVYGFDERTAQPFKYSTAANAGIQTGSATPYLQQVATHRYLRNYGQAKAVLDATTLNNRDWLQAEVSVLGTAHLQPGSLVNLTGTSLPGSSAGRWYVLSARHLIVPSRTGSGRDHKYASYLTLSRNTETGLTFTHTHDLTAQQETMPCQLVNGMWQANVLGDYLV